MAFISGDELAQLREDQAELERRQAFDGPAEQMAAEYEALAQLAITNPRELPPDMYEAAVQLVKESRRKEIIAKAAGTLATQHCARLDQEVDDQEGEGLKAAEEERFKKEDLPYFTTQRKEQRRREIIDTARRELTASRPGQFLREWEEREGLGIRDAEIARFKREDEPRYRTEAKQKGERAITADVRAMLRAKIDGEEATKAREAAEAEERLNLRIDTIQRMARTSRQIPLTMFHEGDALTIDMGPDGQAFNNHASSTTPERILHLSMVSPEQGIVRILDDSWAVHSDRLRKSQGFASGTLLYIDTHNPDGEQADIKTAPAITCSVPLRIVHNKQDRTTDFFDVYKVAIDTGKSKIALLSASHSR